MFHYSLGSWTLVFDREYRVVCDGAAAVVLDEERTALVLVSLTAAGNLRLERTYYAMVCEIDAGARTAAFHTTEDIG